MSVELTLTVVQENIILALSALISSHDSMKEQLTLLNATNAAMSDRITSLEHSLRNIIQNAQTLDDQVDNIHGFCEDLVAGNWDLQELFPTSLRVTVVSHPLAISKAIGTGVDSSTLLYESNFSRTTCPESDRMSFQPC